MTHLTPEQLVKELSKAFGDLLDDSMYGLEHYTNREDLFNDYPEVLNAAKEFLEKQEPVECEFSIDEMFDEDESFYSNAFDGKLVESDTNIALDVALLFVPNDGVYMSNAVRFRPVGTGGPSISYYVYDSGDCMEFEDYAESFINEALENHEGPYTDDYDYDEERYRIRDQIFDNMEKASVSDFDDIAFNEVVLLDLSK